MPTSPNPVVANQTSPILREMAGAVLNAPVAGNTTIVRLPAGRTYHDVIIETLLAAQAVPTRAQLTLGVLNLRLVVSGSEVWSVTGQQLLGIQCYYSEIDTSADGRLLLSFERLSYLAGFDINAILGPSFGTLDQSSFDIEIDWNASSLIVSAKAYARIGQSPENAGKIIRLARVTANMSALGVYQYPDLPAPKKGDFMYCIHIFPAVIANITRIAYIPDEQRMIDLPLGVMNKLAQECHPPRTPQTATNQFSLDFCIRGMPGDAIDLSKVGGHLLELTAINAAPGLIPIVCEIASDLAGVTG